MARVSGWAIGCLLISSITVCAATWPVTIHRDPWGVPHIYAAEESGGFFGLGYAQAEDRLEQLLGAVHWARGTLASLKGAESVESDLEAIRWRHLEEARQGISRLSPRLRRNYQAFIDGVNAYMKQHPEQSPAWAPRIELADLLTLTRAILWDIYQTAEGMADFRRGGEVPGVLPVLSRKKGASNGWAVAPHRTVEGALILSADPHSEIASGAFYEYHIDAGSLKSAGFAMGPLLWQAHNGRVAWAMTTGAPDVVDCYAVAVDPKNPQRYRYDDRWQTMTVENVSVRVAGGSAVERQFEYTHHNGVLSPVVARSEGKAYVLCSAYMHQAGVLDEEIYRMNLADSAEAVREAMRSLGMFPQNLIIGDRDGHMIYLRAGRTPIRPAGYDWRRPVPGNSSHSAWKGIHPLDDLIQVVDPKNSYLQNNNVAPDRMVAPDNPIQAQDYPGYLFNDTPGRITSRGVRTLEVFSSAESFSVQQAIALSLDEKWVTTEHWQRALGYAVKKHETLLREKSSEYKRVLQRLLDFDGFARADSVAALNFYHWREGMWAQLKEERFSKFHTLPWREQDFTPAFARRLLDKIDSSIEKMNHLYGSIDLPLGMAFRMGPSGQDMPLGGVTIEEPGIDNCLADSSPFCERTMRAFSFREPDQQGKRRAYRGSQSLRLVAFTQPLQAYTSYAYGQSSNPESPHYADQVALFSKKRLKRAYFDREDVEKHAVSTMIIHRDVAVHGLELEIGK